MKRNDYILDKNRGIGIIKEINDKASVLFDNLQIYEYDLKSLNVIDERIIDFIKKRANEKLAKDSNALYKISHIYKINITYDNNILSFSGVFDEANKATKVCFDIERPSVSYIFHSPIQNINYIDSAILYLNQRLILLDRFDVNMDKDSEKLCNASLEFIDNFFNLKLFKNLCTLISQQPFETLYHFCIYICGLDVDNNYKAYLFLMVIYNVDLEIAEDLLDASYQYQVCTFTDVFYNFLHGNKTLRCYDIYYSSIQFLKDDKAYEWIKSCFVENYTMHLLTPSYNILANLILIEIIKNAKEIELYWKINDNDSSSNKSYYYINVYHELLFKFTSEENKLFLIENGYISHIPDNFSETFDALKTIKYYRFMSENIKINNINKYFEEIVKVNPQLIVDMIVVKKEATKNKTEMKLIEKVMPYLKDTKYLEVFLKSGINEKGFHNFSETHIM